MLIQNVHFAMLSSCLGPGCINLTLRHWKAFRTVKQNILPKKLLSTSHESDYRCLVLNIVILIWCKNIGHGLFVESDV